MRRGFAVLAASTLLFMSAAIAPPVRATVPDVTIWHAYGASPGSEPDAFGTVLGSVQGRYPGISITGQELGFGNLFGDFAASAPSGHPDLLVAPNDALYGQWQAGLISDVSSTVLPRLLTMRASAAIGSMVGGRWAMIPESVKAIALYYDRAQLPRPPTTTWQFLSAIQHGTRLGVIGFGGEAFYEYGFYGSFGGRIMDARGTCVADRTPGVARALTWLHSAVAAGLVIFPDEWSASDALVNGDIAGLLDGNWVFGGLRAAMGDRLGVVVGPSGPGGPFRPLVGVDGYVINAASPDAAAALTVAKALTDRFAQRTFMQVAGHVPADRTILITDPRIRAFAHATEVGVLRPMNAEFNAYWGPFTDAYFRVVYGDENATQVVGEACDAMNAANGK
jgi:maltose-binding protein MalE